MGNIVGDVVVIHDVQPMTTKYETWTFAEVAMSADDWLDDNMERNGWCAGKKTIKSCSHGTVVYLRHATYVVVAIYNKY